eukprot:358331-Chlamydomonas_euryale.AAC.7
MVGLCMVGLNYIWLDWTTYGWTGVYMVGLEYLWLDWIIQRQLLGRVKVGRWEEDCHGLGVHVCRCGAKRGVRCACAEEAPHGLRMTRGGTAVR